MHDRRTWLNGATLALAALVAFAVMPHRLSNPGSWTQAALGPVGGRTSTAGELSAAFEKVVDVIRPSVVSISSARRVRALQQGPSRDSPLRDFFGDDLFDRAPGRGPRDYVERGLGSGVIVGSDGYILTNNHVVGGADEVTVRLSDDRTLRARVVGTDRKTDLAVLKVAATGLRPARIGDSDALRVGEWVIAVGNPFGLSSSVSAGIVSAKGRANVGVADYEDFIQTDAAINPGNSGGPLVNLDGAVVGINTAIFSRNGGYMGIGFAVPSNMARPVMTHLIHGGRVVRGWLGVTIQDLEPGLARSFGYPGTAGALVGNVEPGGPADRAGLRQGDIVSRFDGRPVTGMVRLRELVAEARPGQGVAVDVFRGGSHRVLQVDVGEQDANRVASAVPGGRDEGVGLQVRTLARVDARQLGLDPALRGAVVTGVAPLSAAERAGLQAGDVIQTVGGDPVTDAVSFRRALGRHDLRKGVRLGVRSGEGRHFVFLRTDGLG